MHNRSNGLSRMFQTWLDQCGRILSPPHIICALCGKRETNPRQRLQGVCSPCNRQVPWIKHIYCDVCGRHEECRDCANMKLRHFLSSRSAVKYDAMMKQWLAVYKYRGHEKLEALFIEMLATAYSSHPAKRGITHITYVPVSEIRLLERGFNQAERLASGLGQKFGLPVIPLLERVRHTDKQSHKSRNERLADLEGAFAVREECLCRLLAGNSNRSLEILLIDDVYTTGSTMNQCACAITRHIRANVYGLTWAR